MGEPSAMPPLRQLGLVFFAGGLGASLRVFLVGLLDRRLESFPFAGTLVVNLVGCFAIGLCSSLLSGPSRTIVMGGLLGGFTTYSAFGLLGWDLLEKGRFVSFAWQILLHIVGGLALVALGLWLGRLAVGPQKL